MSSSRNITFTVDVGIQKNIDVVYLYIASKNTKSLFLYTVQDHICIYAYTHIHTYTYMDTLREILPRDIVDMTSVFLYSTTLQTQTSYRHYYAGRLHGTWRESDGYTVEYVAGRRTERLEDVSLASLEGTDIVNVGAAHREYLDGRPHGTWYTRHPNGQLQYHTEYRDGQLHGVRRVWHANGTLRSRGVYRYGRLDGVLMTWSDDGELESRQEYQNGCANGLHEMWTIYGTYAAIYRNGVEQISLGDLLKLKNSQICIVK